MGETTAGLVGGIPQIKGVSQLPGRPPYPEVMLESMVEDARELGARYLFATGDITAEAVPLDRSRARKLLNRFGKHQHDDFVTRGNHDRSHTGGEYARCRVGEWEGNDCFHDQFFPGDQPTYLSRSLDGLRVLGIDTYDEAGRGSDPGTLSADQFEWFRSQLADHQNQPMMVFGHHPLIVKESPFPIVPSNTLDTGQTAAILGDYAKSPGLFLHHAGTPIATNER